MSESQGLFNVLPNITQYTPQSVKANAPLVDTETNEVIDLAITYWQRTLAERIKLKIENHSDRKDDGFRSHLGWSVIEHECLRYLYYHWRWFWREEHTGRMKRIFLKGHQIEAEFRFILKQLGAQFLDQVEETGEQITVSELSGHFGGSCDGVFIWPEMGLTEPTVLECKSSRTGAPFNDLEKKGLAGTNRRHYIQGSGYAKGLQIKYVLYICRNKNDSSIYVEIVEADWGQAKIAVRKAQHVISLTELPKRISEKRNFFICNMCPHQKPCHDRTPDPIPNCRNCVNAAPAENAQWYCRHWQSIIPKEAIINGCNQHVFLPW